MTDAGGEPGSEPGFSAGGADVGRTDTVPGAAASASASTAAEPSTTDRSPLFIVAAAVVLLGATYLPGLYASAFTSRLPVLFVGGAVGLVGLARLGRSDPAARWLIALTVWSLVSALASSAPLQSLVPALASDRGWLISLAMAGWWAIGRVLPKAGDRYVLGALGVVVVANTLVAIAQVLATSPDPRSLRYIEAGRAMGLLGNPVFLAAVLAGATVGIASAALRTSDDRRLRLGLVVVAVGALGINLSGSRIGTVAVVAGIACAARRGPRHRVALVVAAVVVGTLVSLPIASTGSTSRIASGAEGGGFVPRIETWKAGVESVGERPVLGYGPGRWLEATGPRNTLRSARAETSTTVFADSHNIVLTQLVTLGIPGLLLSAGFVFLAARRARGPFAHAAIALGLTVLVEPFHLVVGTLLLLLLGMADPTDRSPDDEGADRPDLAATSSEVGSGTTSPDLADRASRLAPRAASPVQVVAVALAAFAGIGVSVPYVVAGRYAETATQTLDLNVTVRDYATARRWMPYDPTLTVYEAYQRMVISVWTDSPVQSRRSLALARRAIDLDPHLDITWVQAAQIEARIGPGTEAQRRAKAVTMVEHALTLNPWSAQAIGLLYAFAEDGHDDAAAARWAHKLCEMNLCPEPVPEDPAGN